ncbi:MAG: hypothetical protein IT486_08230 [Gammaproteobacteria bacterium]|nr:hypothetical protein [Gammaproteobacteria bacterium]
MTPRLRFLVVLATLALATGCAPARAPDIDRLVAAPANPAVVRFVTGTLVCGTLSAGEPCGQEQWSLTVQADGTRTMRTLLDAGRDAQQINTLYRTDASFRFLEAFAHSYDEGRLLGSGYYVADGASLQVTTRGPAGFRTEQLPLPPKYSVLLHPPSLEGWHYGQYDAVAAGAQAVPVFIAGAVGDGLRVAAYPIVLEFVARERITVPAGTFDTEHFHFGKDAEVWLAGPDRIVIRHEYRKADTRYELTRLDGPIEARTGS